MCFIYLLLCQEQPTKRYSDYNTVFVQIISCLHNDNIHGKFDYLPRQLSLKFNFVEKTPDYQVSGYSVKHEIQLGIILSSTANIVTLH